MGRKRGAPNRPLAERIAEWVALRDAALARRARAEEMVRKLDKKIAQAQAKETSK